MQFRCPHARGQKGSRFANECFKSKPFIIDVETIKQNTGKQWTVAASANAARFASSSNWMRARCSILVRHRMSACSCAVSFLWKPRSMSAPVWSGTVLQQPRHDWISVSGQYHQLPIRSASFLRPFLRNALTLESRKHINFCPRDECRIACVYRSAAVMLNNVRDCGCYPSVYAAAALRLIGQSTKLYSFTERGQWICSCILNIRRTWEQGDCQPLGGGGG